MDTGGPDWRTIEVGGAPATSPAQVAPGPHRALLVAGVLLVVSVVAAGGAFLVATTPRPSLVIAPATEAGAGASPDALSSSAPASELFVDVAGGVARPGLYRLAAGSRGGDAIVAAGGFAPDADAERVAETVNLAAALVDGAKLLIPTRGSAIAAAAAPGESGPNSAAGGATSSGLLDLNRATQAELEELPGIGPVTAERIIAARAEAPFTSLEDLVTRDVVGQSVLEKIRALVTVGG